MIAGVMRLGDLPVGAVMTPRREVSMINLTERPASRPIRAGCQQPFPLCGLRSGADAAVGIVNAKDMLDCYLSEQTA
jgi:putative hemolysin